MLKKFDVWTVKNKSSSIFWIGQTLNKIVYPIWLTESVEKLETMYDTVLKLTEDSVCVEKIFGGREVSFSGKLYHWLCLELSMIKWWIIRKIRLIFNQFYDCLKILYNFYCICPGGLVPNPCSWHDSDAHTWQKTEIKSQDCSRIVLCKTRPTLWCWFMTR